MDRQAFQDVVERLERTAAANPSGYRTRVVLFGTLGYVYIALVLVLLIGAFVMLILALKHGNAIVLKLGIMLFALVSMVARALWIRLPPPQGRPLSRAEVPELFALIDDVVARTGAPALTEVFLTSDLNASIVQVPRFGVFGGYRNYLSLGLPMLQALTPDEFAAVLAHECGHLTGAHGKSAAWIYRVRAGWAQLAGALEESEHWGRKLFLPFFQWYAPRFAAYSFVAARQQEIEADRVSAAATSAKTSARALVRVSLAGAWLSEKYWPSIFADAATRATPESRPMRALGEGFALGYQAPETDQWLAGALQRNTDCVDTHPSLRDRLAALDVPQPHLPTLERTAAQALLGAREASFADEMDEQWRKAVEPWWQQQHEKTRAQRERQAELESAQASRELSIEEEYELACLDLGSDGNVSAEQRLRKVLGARPDHADAHAQLGFLLARRNDPEAVERLREAIRLDPDWTPTAGQSLASLLEQAGDRAGAAAAIDSVEAWHRRATHARREVSIVRKGDRFEPVTPALVGEAARAALTDAAAGSPDIARLWIIAKVLEPTGQRLPLAVVQLRSTWWKWESQNRAGTRQQQLIEQLPLPEGTMLVVIGPDSKWLRRPARRVGTELYRRR